MRGRRVQLVLLPLVPLAALALFQGMIAAGLVPLAVFAPLYAVARAGSKTRDTPRVEGARAVAAASIGAALAFAVVLPLLAIGVDPIPGAWSTIGLALVASGLGCLAGLSTAPTGRPLAVDEQRRWVFVEALDDRHARGLATLFFATLLAAMLLALLRDAPLFTDADGSSQTLPARLFGVNAVSGYWVVPGIDASLAVAIPLTLVPLALGFLLPVRAAFPLALGSAALLLLVPVALVLDLPIETPGGSFVPLSLRPAPAFDAWAALAPAGAGALLGVGIVTILKRARRTRADTRALWVVGGALLALATHGLVPGTGLVLGTLAAAVALSWPRARPMAAASLVVGVLVGAVAAQLVDHPTALALGALVGVVAASAVTTAGVTLALPLPSESLRSARTLLYLGPALALGGLVAAYAGRALAADLVPFEAPHALALAAGLDAVVTGRSPWLVLWGVAAGALSATITRRGAHVALGFLAGPLVGLLVLIGALLRSWWETSMLRRAQQGHVMRGELGYNLLRLHVVVVAVLAGEGLMLGLTGWFG